MRSFPIVLLLAACAVPSPPDAALPDAPDPSDAPSEPDSPAPADPFCRPCRRDADCGAGAFCSVFPDGTWACVPACAGDDDCSGTPLPTTCGVEAEGLPLGCRPSAGTCAVSPAGSPCGDGCAGTYDVCAQPEPGLGAYCTTRCERDADCPRGLRRCADTEAGRLCVRDEASPAERCEALAATLPPCEAGRTCPAGARCVGAEAPRCLPEASGEVCRDGFVPLTPGGLCVPSALLPGAAPLGALLPDCACLAEDDGLFDELAALAGRSRCGLGFPHALLDRFPAELSHDELRLSWTDRVHSDWLAPPRFAGAVGAELDDAAASAAIELLAGLADQPFLPAAPRAAEPIEALVALVEAAGGLPDEPRARAALASLPAPQAEALGALFTALERALAEREAALRGFGEIERRFFFDAPSALFLAGIMPLSPSRDLVGAMRGDVEVGRMAGAAATLLEAIDALRVAFAGGAGTLGALTIATPAGAIVIGSPGDDLHTESAYLLLLEPGGDDVYRGPVGATASVSNGVSLLLDLGGADDYGYDEVPNAGDLGPEGHTRLPSDADGRVRASASARPSSLSRTSRQGAGRLGIGLLVDAGAEGDRYRSLRMSQGYGALGVGVLIDAGGDDTYDGEAAVQGAAVAGIGLVIDESGSDRYRTYHASQGFAYVRGVGVLLDREGDDDYFAHPSDVLYESPQSPGASNSSFAQGVGFGRRDDAGRLYMSGGLGVLRDAAGSDRYTCGIFGQASGYWYGTGLLLEGGGDDHYDGEWYVQAGDAHFAIAVLLDEAGRDVHNERAVRRNAMLAGGHDFSSAWLIDRDGDDTYLAPGLTLGVGHAGGFGAFVDLAGDDTYGATGGLSFGSASIETPGDAARRISGTVGLFLDRGGLDTYARPALPPVASDASWTQATHEGESEAGAGMDRAGGRVGAGLD